MILALLIFLWFFAGLALTLMAGLTHEFKERHFDPLWMMPLGPLGWPLWLYMDKTEARRRAKRKEKEDATKGV